MRKGLNNSPRHEYLCSAGTTDHQPTIISDEGSSRKLELFRFYINDLLHFSSQYLINLALLKLLGHR